MKNLSRAATKNLCYYSAVFLTCFFFWSMNNFMSDVGSVVINSICFALFAVSINFKNMSKSNIIIGVNLLILSMISLYATGSFSIMKIVLFILASKGREVRKILKAMFSAAVASLIINIMITVSSGKDMFIEANFGRGEIERRLAFGFKNPNNLHAIFLFISLSFLLYTKRYTKKIDVIIFAVLNILLYIFTASRTGFLVGILTPILFFIINGENEKKKVHNKRAICFIFAVYLLMIIAPFVLLLTYNSELTRVVNSLTTNRLLLARNFIDEYGIDLFGSKIVGSYVVDLGIVSFVVRYGLIASILYIIGQFILIRKYIGTSEYLKIAIIFLFLFYGLSEDVLYYIPVNISILFFPELFESKRVEK